MRKRLGLLLIACFLIFAGCDTNGNNSNNEPTTPSPLEFRSTVNGETLEIIISRTSIPRSTLNPQAGDYYIIRYGNKEISAGAISTVGAGGSITFIPADTTQESFSGTINLDKQTSAVWILEIPKIPYSGGDLLNIATIANNNNENNNSDTGKLTITGLVAYNGKYVVVGDGGIIESEISLFAASTVNLDDYTFTGGYVINGSVVLNVWQLDEETESVIPFKGNGFAGLVLYAFDSPNSTFDDEQSYTQIGFVFPTFTNGNGSGELTLEIPPWLEGDGDGQDSTPGNYGSIAVIGTITGIIDNTVQIGETLTATYTPFSGGAIFKLNAVKVLINE